MTSITTGVGHVDAHNVLRDGIVREAQRFGITVDIGGPYNVNDPGHVQEHEKSRAALAKLAKTAGITVELPPVRHTGDPGHAPDDHDKLEAALVKIAAADAFMIAKGGVESYIMRAGVRYKVHRFSLPEGRSGAFTVVTAPRPVKVALVGAGAMGNYDPDPDYQVGGGGGGVFHDEAFAKFEPGTYQVEAGYYGTFGKNGGDSWIKGPGVDIVATGGRKNTAQSPGGSSGLPTSTSTTVPNPGGSVGGGGAGAAGSGSSGGAGIVLDWMLDDSKTPKSYTFGKGGTPGYIANPIWDGSGTGTNNRYDTPGHGVVFIVYETSPLD